MTRIDEVYNAVDAFAPFNTAEAWDNCGLLVRGEREGITKALLAVDITPATIDEAAGLGAELIISHHPVIFAPLSRLNSAQPAYLLAKHNISAICAHTNLDLAVGGVNDILAARLCLKNIRPLGKPDANGLSLGRMGEFDLNVEQETGLKFIRKNLGANGVGYTAYDGILRRIAVCGGAGADLLERAAELGADALITGEAKHHHLLLAESLGIMLILAGHLCTERVVLAPFAEYLSGKLPEVEFAVSRRECDPVKVEN